jgi:hypothetical protein
MPANRTVASLSIALIVFVMLTFVLAITTYLFFKQRLDEQQKAEAAAAETSKARTERDEKRKLQEMLGAPEDKSIDQIEAETNARFAGEFAAFDAEPKTYLRLVEWLGAALRKKDTQMDAQRADHEKAISEKEQAIKKEQDDAKLAMEQKETADKDKQSEKDAFDAARKQFEQQQARLTEGERKALDQSTKYDKLRAEVAKGVQYLTPDRQKDFQSKQDPEAQLDVLYAVLRGQAKEIEGKNELLAKLRVADAAVQAAVDAAIPKDDRVDGFDGRVVSVDEAERTALVSCNSTRGMRPGLLLSVYDPKDPRPQVGSRKGLLEVIAVESPTVARARIRRDSIRNPILGGDGVATSLWAPGETPEVVVVGYVQLDTDAEADLESLRAAVERAGGRLVDGVTPATAIVVDAGLPKVAGGGKAAGWKQTDERRREREIKAARGLGVRVVGIDEMLDLLGMERAELEGGRLPMRGDDGRSLPRRSAGVAY